MKSMPSPLKSWATTSPNAFLKAAEARKKLAAWAKKQWYKTLESVRDALSALLARLDADTTAAEASGMRKIVVAADHAILAKPEYAVLLEIWALNRVVSEDWPRGLTCHFRLEAVEALLFSNYGKDSSDEKIHDDYAKKNQGDVGPSNARYQILRRDHMQSADAWAKENLG